MRDSAIRPAIRVLLTLLGILLVVGAFAAVLMAGALTAKPPVHLVVAARDLGIGERVTQADLRVLDVVIDPALAQLHVQANELDAYAGAQVMDVIRRGDLLNKVKLRPSGGPGESEALRRNALVLDRPNDVLMVLPVNPDVIPSGLSAGDYVNILFTAGNESGVNRLPNDNKPEAIVLQAPALQAPVPFATPRPTSLPLPPALAVTPTPTPTPEMVLPLADIMLERVPIVAVNTQKLQNPNYGSERPGGDQPFVDGPIMSIVVKVPASHQTVLAFGAATSKLRFTLLSPLTTEGDVRPRGALDWASYVQLVEWKNREAQARGETLSAQLYPGYTPVAPTPTPIMPFIADPSVTLRPSKP